MNSALRKLISNPDLWVVLVVVSAPLAGLYPLFGMKLMCFALFACAFNLLLGFAGILSFGHAAFFGAASYTTAYLATAWNWQPQFSVLAGTATAAVLGLVFGILTIRRQGIYFAMITLALAQMVYYIALHAPFTGGEDGLQGVPRGKLLGIVDLQPEMNMYYVVAVTALAAYFFISRIVSSPFGQVLRMIRENEPRAISLGYNVQRFKLLAFILSGGISGLAGSMKALTMGFVSLVDVHWALSGDVIIMCLIGGVGTLVGPALGAVIVVSMHTLLADKVGGWVNVIVGMVFILCVMTFRRGIIGEITEWRRKRLERGTTKAPLLATSVDA